MVFPAPKITEPPLRLLYLQPAASDVHPSTVSSVFDTRPEPDLHPLPSLQHPGPWDHLPSPRPLPTPKSSRVHSGSRPLGVKRPEARLGEASPRGPGSSRDFDLQLPLPRSGSPSPSGACTQVSVSEGSPATLFAPHPLPSRTGSFPLRLSSWDRPPASTLDTSFFHMGRKASRGPSPCLLCPQDTVPGAQQAPHHCLLSRRMKASGDGEIQGAAKAARDSGPASCADQLLDLESSL